MESQHNGYKRNKDTRTQNLYTMDQLPSVIRMTMMYRTVNNSVRKSYSRKTISSAVASPPSAGRGDDTGMIAARLKPGSPDYNKAGPWPDVYLVIAR